MQTCALHEPGETYLSKSLVSIWALRGVEDAAVRFFFVFSIYINFLLHWCCFGYSYCYFCTVLCNRYFTAVIHLHIILSFLQDSRVFITLISYNCFLIRVCFTLCCNVKVTFFHIGWKMFWVDRSHICIISVHKSEMDNTDQLQWMECHEFEWKQIHIWNGKGTTNQTRDKNIFKEIVNYIIYFVVTLLS